MISNYSELQTEINDWSHRSDLSSKVPSFIRLAETEMQVRCKLVDFESTVTLPVVAGVATVPSDFAGMRSIYWEGDPKRPLRYITPDRYDAESSRGGVTLYYTLTGDSLKTTAPMDGAVVITYKARFTPLSDSAPENAILSNYPDAYLQGSLKQVRLYTKDFDAAQIHAAAFEDALKRIIKDGQDRKYAGPLEVRPR